MSLHMKSIRQTTDYNSSIPKTKQRITQFQNIHTSYHNRYKFHSWKSPLELCSHLERTTDHRVSVPWDQVRRGMIWGNSISLNVKRWNLISSSLKSSNLRKWNLIRHNLIRHNLKRQNLKRHNPVWLILVLTASISGSIALSYFTLNVYSVYNDENDHVDSKTIFFPVWFSVNWPIQKRYSFPEDLKYIDKKYYEELLDHAEFAEKLRDVNVVNLILDHLFRLSLIRDKFGIPLTVESVNDDSYSMWIEPKYPTVHGPQVEIGKLDGNLHFLWDWTVKSLDWFGKINGIMEDLESKLDPMICGEENSGVAGDSSLHFYPRSILSDQLKVAEKCGNRPYRVHTKGTYHLHSSTDELIGVLFYLGVIDFTHLGINRGFRVTSLHLKTVEDGKAILYKLS